ncbi:Uncharacterized protein APZ42_023937 [Daphnia magna]|uniref:Uncharacterized protein n=1 Tax=Daphnia magna TaxID=35525 RepID=A0A164UAH8_9CRUS|nr:Uncharacterized protein APZ42_023937 [Daphnia magna]
MSSLTESNLRPVICHAAALPLSYYSHNCIYLIFFMIQYLWTLKIFLKCRSWDKGANHGPTNRRWPGNLTVYLSDACPRTPLQVAAWWSTELASAALGIRRCIA